MHTDRFDRLTKTLSAADTRRGLLRRGAALPLASLLAALLGAAREVGAERPVDRLLRRTPQRRRRGTNNGTNNRTNNGNNRGSGAPCGSGPACPSGQVCLSGVCYTTCPAPTGCDQGDGGCPGDLVCVRTTSGASVCIAFHSNVPCTTDAECVHEPHTELIGPICVVNPPDNPCVPTLDKFCAGAGLR
jgi:hypothetical protein